MSDFSGDQIHPASPARREQARRDGDFAKSHELAAAVQMLGAMGVAWLLFRQLALWMQHSTIELWSQPTPLTKIDTSQFVGQIRNLIFSSLGSLAPIAVMLMLVGIASHWCQTGPVFLANKPSPDAGRLAPGHWWGRLFSVSTLAYPLIGLPKSVLAMLVMVVSCWYHRETFFVLGNVPADQMVGQLFSLVLTVCTHVALMLFAASVLDFGIKLLGFQKRIRMTDQQVRDESRAQNGDPQISAQRRAMRSQNRG